MKIILTYTIQQQKMNINNNIDLYNIVIKNEK